MQDIQPDTIFEEVLHYLTICVLEHNGLRGFRSSRRAAKAYKRESERQDRKTFGMLNNRLARDDFMGGGQKFPRWDGLQEDTNIVSPLPPPAQRINASCAHPSIMMRAINGKFSTTILAEARVLGQSSTCSRMRSARCNTNHRQPRSANFIVENSERRL